TAGQKLGDAGLSGQADVTMLSFQLYHDDRAVDPFTGKHPGEGCGSAEGRLWDSATATALAYRPSMALDQGFATTPPKLPMIEEGAYSETKLVSDSLGLAFWVKVAGLRAGDRAVLDLYAPGGKVIAHNELPIDRPGADMVPFVGRKRPEGGWPAGT